MIRFIKNLPAKLSYTEKLLALSAAFTLISDAFRFLYSNETEYFFYPWNLFLAALPLVFSRQLKKINKLNTKAVLLLMGWLLFFPNAPYLITDLFHFQQRPPVPYWFDLLIVTSGAWTGTALGFVSLRHTEKFLAKHLKKKYRLPVTVLLIILCSYGIYLGRFLRFNSWDVFTRPKTIAHVTISHFIQPWQHQQFWAFTFSFAALLMLMYFTVRKVPVTNAE